MFEFVKRLFSPARHTGRLSAPGSLAVDELARRLGATESELRATPISYYTFHIPKRRGGTRVIQAPNSQLKAMQRRILYRLLRRLRAHPCATGFERGHSIVTNALTHVGKDVVLRLDVKDFFGTTSATRVESYFRAVGWDADAGALLTRLCTHNGLLPQGAPTSPRLSNLVNHRLDARLFALAQSRGVSYSRYADDIVFSGPADAGHPAQRMNPKTLESVPAAGTRINDLISTTKLIAAEEGYVLHTDKKLRIARRHDRQMVTGLVVNEKADLPRRTRRRLRAIEHRLRTRGTASLTREQLAGWNALRSMIAHQSAPPESNSRTD